MANTKLMKATAALKGAGIVVKDSILVLKRINGIPIAYQHMLNSTTETRNIIITPAKPLRSCRRLRMLEHPHKVFWFAERPIHHIPVCYTAFRLFTFSPSTFTLRRFFRKLEPLLKLILLCNLGSLSQVLF